MFGLPLAFAAPAVLAALIGLVGLYFLLRVTPPAPRRAIFPPLRLLLGLDPNETTPAHTPSTFSSRLKPSASPTIHTSVTIQSTLTLLTQSSR